jgi:hypothetical protein
MEPTEIPYPNPSVISQEIYTGEAVLVNLDTAASLALNPSGVIVWQLVDGQLTINQIIEGVRDYFEDVPNSMEADVTALLETLTEGGFIGFELKKT